MNNILKTISLSTLSLLMLSGCATSDLSMKQNKELYANQKMLKRKDFNKDILEEYNKMKIREDEQQEQTYNIYNIEIETQDIMSLEKYKKDFYGNDLDAVKRLQLLSYLTDSGIFIKDRVSSKLKNKKLSFNFKNQNLAKIVRVLEEELDVNIIYEDNMYYVYDDISIEFKLNDIPNTDVNFFDNLKTQLSSIITKQPSDKVLIDNMSGIIKIKSSPNQIRKNINAIEKILTEAVSYSLLKLSIYKINNSVLREKSLSVELFLEDIMSVRSTGSITESPILSALFKKNKITQVDNKDLGMAVGFQLLQKEGILHSVSNTIVSLNNNRSLLLSNTKEQGSWIPGKIETEDTVINGVIKTVETEGQPTFEKVEVGLKLKFLSRIDLQNKQISLYLKYDDSDISSISTTTWNRSENNSISLNQNLLGKNGYENIIRLEDRKYRVLSGLKENSLNFGGSYNPLITVLGNKNNSVERNDILMLAKPIMPTKRKVITVRNRRY